MKRSRVVPTVLIGLFLAVGVGFEPAQAEGTSLPERTSPRPQTTSTVPHVQIGVRSVPEIDAALLRQVASLHGVEIRPTVISLPGAKGFWLNERVELARPKAILGGREFAHVHPDGSLHASLTPERAREAVEAGWAVLHPWADQRAGWEGFVMLYTPQSMEELAVVFQLVVDSYNFVTGRDYLGDN